MEFSETHAHADGMRNNGASATVSYQSFSFIPMLRASFFKTDSMPGGLVNLYGGFGLDFIPSANIDATIPPLPPVSASSSMSNSTNNTFGTTLLIGASLRFSKIILFAEWRATEASFSYSYLGDGVSIPVSANETVLGVAYRF